MDLQSWAAVATVVAAFIGAIALQTRALDRRFDGLDLKIDGVEQRLDAKIDGVEQRLDAKIDAQGADIRAEMRAGFERVDARFAQVDARFAQVDARLNGVDARLYDLSTRLPAAPGAAAG